ncbi:MAG: hypothetical protein M3Z11_06675, partial [Candidatus Dormibacteraeota bacterium]|nr:hypothetical protein [Candidatus Dormibacteraeota bacterium]
MRRLLSLGLLLLAACGPPGTATQGSPTPSTAASGRASATPGEVQFVVLEARGPHSQMGAEPGGADAHDRVAIVGLDGVARAKADFTPRALPVVGNAAPLLQPEARVSGGRVFYADGAGIVRELTRSGVKPVATFPLKAQQEISFGVSPDGAHLEASRYSYPPLNPNSTDMSNMFLSSTYRYELLAASNGGDT